jgi:hypothetical protein
MKKIFLPLAVFALIAAGCNKAPQLNYPSGATSSPQTNTGSPSSTPVSNPGTDENTYVSPSKLGFSIKYPSDFVFSTDYSKVQALGYIPVCDQTMVACMFYSGDAYKGTNFEDAGVSVNILSALNTQAKCYNFKVSTNEAQQPVADVTLGGIVFKSAIGGDAAAGHAMKTQQYRNFHNNQCYEIAQRLGSTNIGNYAPGTIQPFNQGDVWQKLQGIVTTFQFTAPTAQTPAVNSHEVTLTGTTVCLPHKNVQPGQPQTMECAIGLKELSSGRYFGLKNSSPGFIDANMNVQVTGILQPDLASFYNIVGTIQVTSIVQLDKMYKPFK